MGVHFSVLSLLEAAAGMLATKAVWIATATASARKRSSPCACCLRFADSKSASASSTVGDRAW